jgi:hypothetical protein
MKKSTKKIPANLLRLERFKYILEHLCYVILNKVKGDILKVTQKGIRNYFTSVYVHITAAT